MKYYKPKYYLIAFSLFYLLLLGIMVFYFAQVLELKKKEIHSIAHEKIDALEPVLSFEKGSKKKDNFIYRAVLDLLQKKTTLEEIKSKNRSLFEAANLDATKKIDSTFRELGYKVAFRIDLTDVIINSTKENLLLEPITILQTEKDVKKAHRINSSEWEVEESSTNKSDETCIDCPIDYKNHFTVKQEKYIEVINFNRIAFRELFPLLLGSFLICTFILILYYITYKTIKKKEQEVLSLHNMVDNVSHEFKLPIATLKYGCNNLQQEYNSATIELIQRQVSRLERLQNQLGGFVETTDHAFSKADLVQLLADLKLKNEHVSFTLAWDLDDKLNFPQTEIETILLNLLENSIKYGGTAIVCTLKENEGKLCIQVADNGIGIAKAEQNLIFQKFYRVRHHNIHNTLGLGIGLYQVKQIVDRRKGRVQLKSKLTEGTTFTILLPYV
ncbi:sensor histidine kinase [Myroides odoratus]|uniref:sensor histidine kinase n=1 Tax=Myroides odoratus TaxID=256 RepID=UPI0039AF7B28